MTCSIYINYTEDEYEDGAYWFNKNGVLHYTYMITGEAVAVPYMDVVASYYAELVKEVEEHIGKIRLKEKLA